MSFPTIYEGNEPYIFVSYSHRDTDKVVPILSELSKRGYRLWFDTNIYPGDAWPQTIAEHLYKCDVFLTFISQSYVASQNCYREINFAIGFNKKQLTVYLDDAEMPLGIQMQLGVTQSVFRQRHLSLESFISDMCRGNLLLQCLPEDRRNGLTDAVYETPEVCYNKGLELYNKNEHYEASKWFQKAADSGHTDAQYRLGCIYMNQNMSVKGFALMLKAAQQGHASAQAQVAYCYKEGKGVNKDPYESFKWYGRAAMQGDSWAKYFLGCCYMDGYGTVKDTHEALEWFIEARDEGVISANGKINELIKKDDSINPLNGDADDDDDFDDIYVDGQKYDPNTFNLSSFLDSVRKSIYDK